MKRQDFCLQCTKQWTAKKHVSTRGRPQCNVSFSLFFPLPGGWWTQLLVALFTWYNHVKRDRNRGAIKSIKCRVRPPGFKTRCSSASCALQHILNLSELASLNWLPEMESVIPTLGFWQGIRKCMEKSHILVHSCHSMSNYHHYCHWINCQHQKHSIVIAKCIWLYK